MRTRRTELTRLVALVALAGLVLAACRDRQAPVPVYVTPTPEIVADTPLPMPPAPPSATPTEPAAVAAAPSATPSPAVTFGPIFGPGVTLSPTPTSTPGTPAAGVTFGPIVGPGHTLVPTETRLPPTPQPTATPTPGPSPTPAPSLDRSRLGIQIHPHIDSREFESVLSYAHDLGVSWVKYQFNWSLLESAPGQYTELFYMLRLYVQQTHAHGFKVLVSVAKAPGWSRTPDADGVMREDGPPDDPQALANFLSGMLNAIGSDASGAPVISAIEIWNEPNLQREWYGYALTGAEYMRYFGPAYSAVRAFSPAITIITAAPAPTGDSAWSTNDRNWLQGLYSAGLARYGTDVAVGVHPYGWANPPEARCCANPSRGWDEQPQFYFADTIEDYRQIMVANNHADAQLWATEVGWATFDGLKNSQGYRPPDPPDTPYFSFINQWQQAEYTLRALYLAQERPYMGPVFIWNLNFATIPGAVDRSDPQTAYALVDSQWQPRPVFLTLQQAPKS